MARQNNSAAEKSSRKIEIGWLHFSDSEYRQVRTKKWWRNKTCKCKKRTTTVAQVLELGKFFKYGHSTQGQVENFIFNVCILLNVCIVYCSIYCMHRFAPICHRVTDAAQVVFYYY